MKLQMKNLFLVLFATLVAQPALAASQKPFKLDWGMESEFIETADEGIYTFVFPYERGMDPKVEIDPDSGANCDVISAKRVGNKFIFKIAFEFASDIDEGFNGCGIDFARNTVEDEDGSGIVFVELGWSMGS